MKILIASTPATGSALRSRIEGTGAQFHAFPAGADLDLRDLLSVAPELKDIPPGRNGCASPLSACSSSPSPVPVVN
jgi:hypothetical protein